MPKFRTVVLMVGSSFLHPNQKVPRLHIVDEAPWYSTYDSAILNDYSEGCWATCPDFESHRSGTLEPPELLPEILLHGALDMSLHGICIRDKEASQCLWHVCLGRTAYHMLTHVKSLSRHKIPGGSHPYGMPARPSLDRWLSETRIIIEVHQ